MIKLINSTFYHEDKTKKELCKFILKSKQLSIGLKCAKFEENFSKWQKRKYCVMFNTGSSANIALIQSLLNLGHLKKQDLVAYSAITWATNVMPLLQLGLEVLPVDIELNTLNISLNTLKEAYSKKSFKCLFVTNLLGFGNGLVEIKKFCKEKNILLIEDNCESLGSETNGVKLGNFGQASTFSFFVGHHLSTIEGGAVCTDDFVLYNALKMVRSHGWDRHLEKSEQKKLRKKYKVNDFYSKYTFYDLAYNLRPTEIQGFLGLNQLRYLDEMVDKREKNYKKLLKIYNNSDFVKMDAGGMNKISNFAFPVICKNSRLAKKYINKCKKAEVEVRPIVGGLMTAQPFYRKYVKTRVKLKNAEFVQKNGFYFGNHPELKTKELRLLINLFNKG